VGTLKARRGSSKFFEIGDCFDTNSRQIGPVLTLIRIAPEALGQ